MSNRPLLLLRGLLREQRHWGEFLSCLHNRFPERRLLTLDIPGNGSLCEQKSPCSIPQITESLRTQLRARAIFGRLELVAISMGGMIALDWMSRYPAEIAGAVLINTSARPYSPFYWRLRWRNYARLASLLWLEPSEREKLILSITSNRHGQNARILERWLSWQRQNPVTGANALRQILAAATFQVRNKPEPPLLLIASRSDRLVDYRCSTVLAALWRTAYFEHPTAGHDLPLDEPQWLSEKIALW
ncbi:MAG: alpha/beta fold hydrolase, partial [Gammaproteobacteria bacterium]